MADPDDWSRIPRGPSDLAYFLRPLFVFAAALAVLAWLVVGVLVSMAVAANHADVPENMTGLGVAVILPPALVAALGLSSVSAWCYCGTRSGRTSLVIAIATAVAAVIAACFWRWAAAAGIVP
ncbi:hypothetical protein [Micromonospora sp. NPDC047740]|uniref:hypothetical protein n=1 Tax=Micromonospora sp. NPDC047740 TaxID=3364254 RepID=UPI00371ABA73